jgi:redox-sensitive bicupin YhaK (pirin superfamily)
MTKSILYPANERGYANHGWLEARHSFSFASYHDPKKVHFGTLRVLNDDIIKGGFGFGKHPHDNMEIITIPLSGALEHQDSMGHKEVIRKYDVQIMSAGKGIYHSEYNHHKDQEINLLQIWLFPKLRNIEPRYDQKTYLPEDRQNKLQVVVSPTDGEGVWINQDAWFSLGNFDAGQKINYNLKKTGNGLYAFVIEGEVEINGQKLGRRDAIGLWDTQNVDIEALNTSEILLMDIPMEI